MKAVKRHSSHTWYAHMCTPMCHTHYTYVSLISRQGRGGGVAFLQNLPLPPPPPLLFLLLSFRAFFWCTSLLLLLLLPSSHALLSWLLTTLPSPFSLSLSLSLSLITPQTFETADRIANACAKKRRAELVRTRVAMSTKTKRLKL